jgi:hypothetical protein
VLWYIAVISFCTSDRPRPQRTCVRRLQALWHVCNVASFDGESCQHLAELPNWTTTPYRLSVSGHLIYWHQPPHLQALPPSATWGRPVLWWQGPSFQRTVCCIGPSTAPVTAQCHAAWTGISVCTSFRGSAGDLVTKKLHGSTAGCVPSVVCSGVGNARVIMGLEGFERQTAQRCYIQLINDLPTKYLITVFTASCHWSLRWIKLTRAIISDTISLISILILSSHLCQDLQLASSVQVCDHTRYHSCYIPCQSLTLWFNTPQIICATRRDARPMQLPPPPVLRSQSKHCSQANSTYVGRTSLIRRRAFW